MNLYIEKGEKTLLPKKYHKINNACAIIYDQLTEIFKEAKYEEMKVTTISVSEDIDSDLKKIRDGEVGTIEWLRMNKYHSQLTDILTKDILMAVVSDFLNFMFESLNCAKRGKMIVAYSLLRKPMMDELLILEQLLNDKEDFIKRIYHIGDPKGYDPGSRSLQKEDKIEIIKNAINKLEGIKLYSADIIYDLRYEKSAKNGINGKTNKAIHIVTTDNNYKTENQNLNFIFSDKDDIHNYMEHYYAFVPYLLAYAVSVIDEIVFSFLTSEENQYIKAMKNLRRTIGIKICSNKSMPTLYHGLRKFIKIDCKTCKTTVSFTKPDWELFFETQILLCPICFNNLLSAIDGCKPIKNFIGVK